MSLLPFEKRKREVLVKKESQTSKEYGKHPEERSVEELLEIGVLCVNKVAGPTSHQVADFVKRILKVEKAGHGGTLDPGVTGVLPTALNKATRVMDVLLKGGKEYVCLMHLHKPVDTEIIKKEMASFVGKITQLPPVRSAVKRQKRQREIYYLDILEIQKQDILFVMGCQAGTYVRKFCHDFGKQLKVGAHMAQLIRSKAGPFTDKEWYSLHDIQDAFIAWKEKNDESLIRKVVKPMEYATQHLGKVWVSDTTVDTLCHGANLSVPGISKFESNIQKGDVVAIFTLKNELIGIGLAQMSSEEIKSNEKGLAVKPTKTFMEPEIYPHFQKANVL